MQKTSQFENMFEMSICRQVSVIPLTLNVAAEVLGLEASANCFVLSNCLKEK